MNNREGGDARYKIARFFGFKSVFIFAYTEARVSTSTFGVIV
jgi:hypothetical protein